MPPVTKTIRIPAGSDTSEPLFLGDAILTALQIPTDFDGTQLSVEGCIKPVIDPPEDFEFVEVDDDEGNQVGPIPVTPDTIIALSKWATPFAMLSWVQFISDAMEADERELLVVLKA